MTNDQVTDERRWSPWRIIGWGLAALILLLPLLAMQFTQEVNWTASDFLFASILMLGVGIPFELTVRLTRSRAYRGGVAAALGAAFLTVWANGAVGMIGSEDNPYNLLFLGAILLALVGSVLVRLKAAGMSIVMLVAAIAHAGVAAGGMSSDPRGALFSIAFAGLWLVAAALFRNARQEQ